MRLHHGRRPGEEHRPTRRNAGWITGPTIERAAQLILLIVALSLVIQGVIQLIRWLAS